jgi:hypothetical protein
VSDRRPQSAAEALERVRRITERKLELLNDPEFVASNIEALEAFAAGERGRPLSEFLKERRGR